MIGEVSDLCQVPQHVLRYWEQEFPDLSPTRRRGRRYYERKDVILIRQIRSLLWEQGFTVEGARRRLAGDEGARDNDKSRQIIRQVLSELEELLALLKS